MCTNYKKMVAPVTEVYEKIVCVPQPVTIEGLAEAPQVLQHEVAETVPNRTGQMLECSSQSCDVSKLHVGFQIAEAPVPEVYEKIVSVPLPLTYERRRAAELALSTSLLQAKMVRKPRRCYNMFMIAGGTTL